MPATGEQADVLRALGRFLDEQGASEIEIVNREAFLAVSWKQRTPGEGQRAYQEHELEALREQAREMRKGSTGNPLGALAEMLRTLGQDLDQKQVEVTTITQEAEGFRVSGTASGRYFRELYPTGSLLMNSKRRRVGRGQRPRA